MTQTKNYNLNKIETSDEVLTSINAMSNNMDILDENLYKKVEKEEGKGLSTNDYTSEEKDKVARISDDIAESLLKAKQYTDEEIAKVDLTKYTTKEYVDNLIGDYETAMTNLIEGAGV